MEFRPYITESIARRLYTAFIKWGENNNADSFGYYEDGEPWVKIGMQLIAYNKWEKYFKNKQLQINYK